MSEEISVTALQDRVRQFAKLRSMKEAKEADLKLLNEEISGMKTEITNVLIAHNQSSFRVDGVGLVSVKTLESVPGPKTSEDNKALYTYVFNKYGEEACLSKFKIHAKTLESFFKEERATLKDPVQQELFRLPGVGEPKIFHDISFRSDKE